MMNSCFITLVISKYLKIVQRMLLCSAFLCQNERDQIYVLTAQEVALLSGSLQQNVHS